MSTTYTKRTIIVDSINTTWSDISDIYTFAIPYNQPTAHGLEINPVTAFIINHTSPTQYANIEFFIDPSDDTLFMVDYAAYILTHPTVDISTYKVTVEYGI